MPPAAAAAAGKAADKGPVVECGKTVATVTGGTVVYSVCRARFFGRHSFRSMCRHRRVARVHWPNTCGVCLSAVSTRIWRGTTPIALRRRQSVLFARLRDEEIERHICAAHADTVAALHTTRCRVDHRATPRLLPKRFRCRVCGRRL